MTKQIDKLIKCWAYKNSNHETVLLLPVHGKDGVPSKENRELSILAAAREDRVLINLSPDNLGQWSVCAVDRHGEHKLTGNYDSRKKAINSLLEDFEVYKADTLNLDVELVKDDDNPDVWNDDCGDGWRLKPNTTDELELVNEEDEVDDND